MRKVGNYTRPNGKSPYDEFLARVKRAGDVKKLAKIGVAVRQLAEKGSQKLVEIGLAEKMNDLWQLRPVPYRVFYFWDPEQKQYVLLSGYRKKSKEADLQELQKAEMLMVEYLTRSRKGEVR